MKHVKKFESFSYDRFSQTMKEVNNAKPGDIIDESTVYMYVQYLTENSIINDYESTFIDGDLGDRIERYKQYVLEKVPLDKLDLNEWYLDDYSVTEYAEQIKKSGYCPPLVLDDKYGIIDGTHRANALDKLGRKEVLSFVGIK